jgi:hypothetical protein
MAFSVSSSYTKLRSIVDTTPNAPLPSPASIQSATKTIVSSLPTLGLGEEATETHLLHDLPPGFNGPKTSSNYYGFVTGGVFPIAEAADNIVTAFDQSPMVHLPSQSISTIVEDRALSMLVELLNLGPDWGGKTFTTGATGANILGLACGREAVLNSRVEDPGSEVGAIGLLAACQKAGVNEIQVLTTMGHSSLYKATSVVGLGRQSVKEIPVSDSEPWKMDLAALERELRRSGNGVLSIVVISAGEVNSGKWAVNGLEEMERIRFLCDEYAAWLHVDGGKFASSPFFIRRLNKYHSFWSVRPITTQNFRVRLPDQPSLRSRVSRLHHWRLPQTAQRTLRLRFLPYPLSPDAFSYLPEPQCRLSLLRTRCFHPLTTQHRTREFTKVQSLACVRCPSSLWSRRTRGDVCETSSSSEGYFTVFEIK